MLLRDLLNFLRSKTRREWAELYHQNVVVLRIWLQENGEVGALISLIIGMVIVLFFKLFVFLIVFGGLVAYTVWQLADSGDRD